MENKNFQIGICQESGYIVAFKNPFDSDSMDWCATGKSWGRICGRKTEAVGHEKGSPVRYCKEEIKLENLDIMDQAMPATYSNNKIMVTVDRFFTKTGNLKEHYQCH